MFMRTFGFTLRDMRLMCCTASKVGYMGSSHLFLNLQAQILIPTHCCDMDNRP
jgi:hypothetical protein